MVGEEQGWILECFRPCCFYEYSRSTKETIRSLQSKVERLSTFALACFPEALEPMLLTRHSDKVRSNVLVHSPLLVSKKEMSVGSVSRVCHVISTWQYFRIFNIIFFNVKCVYRNRRVNALRIILDKSGQKAKNWELFGSRAFIHGRWGK